MKKEKYLILFLLFFFMTVGGICADEFSDDFSTVRNYLTEGVTGSGWDGFIGQDVNQTVNKLNASIDRAGKLYMESQGARWEPPFVPLGPFLYKIVSGDFIASVYVSESSNIQWNDVGIMARVADLAAAGPGEDLEAVDHFLYIGLNMVRADDDGVESEVTTSPIKPYLRLRRQGNTFYHEASSDGITWTLLNGSPRTRNDFAGLPLQVGLQHASYTATAGFVVYDDFVLNFVTPETNPPLPNPAAFEKAPYAISDTAITMTAVEGSDESGYVEYYFDETSGNPGGTDSGWILNRVYTDVGLSPSTQYIYTVRMRDVFENTTDVSGPAEVATLSAGSIPGLLVYLSADDLAESQPVTSWLNRGSLSGNFLSQGSPPVAGLVDGRKAVIFDGADYLVSSFTSPASITGSSDYTVAVWVYNPQIAQEECIIQWARRGTTSRDAQLNFGNHPLFGAVTHWGTADMGFDGGVPSAGKWHHIAVTYSGGTGGIEKLYVDGKLNASETKTLDLWTGDPMYLGCAIESDLTTRVLYLSGSVAEVRIYDQQLTEQQLEKIMHPWQIYNPNPPDHQSGIPGENVVLSWSAGLDINNVDVYFGTDYNDVLNASSQPICPTCLHRSHQSVDVNTYEIPQTLEYDGNYFWRVDAEDLGGTIHKGEVWNFKVFGYKANNPQPADFAADVNIMTLLTWNAGLDANSHDLYFATDRDEVENASRPIADFDGDGKVDANDLKVIADFWLAGVEGSSSCFDFDGDGKVTFKDFAHLANGWLDEVSSVYKGIFTLEQIVFEPNLLMTDADYYWRVDEINCVKPVKRIKGDVWTFRTGKIGKIRMTNNFFDLEMDAQTGGFMWMSNTDDTATANFLLSKDKYPQYDIDDSYWLGDLRMRYRLGGGSWQTATTGLSDDVRSFAIDNTANPSQITVSYKQDAANANGIRNFNLTESWSLSENELVWEIKLKNRSGQSLEVGDLGIYFPFRSIYDGDTTEIQQNRFIRHDFVSGNGSFLLVHKVSGKEPYLVVTPSGETKLEYFGLIGFMYDSIPIMYVHSAVTGPATAGTWRQAHTSRTLADSEEITYGFRFQFADSYNSARAVLYENDQFDIRVVPGMTVPTDLTALISLRTKNTINSVTAEFPAQTQITYLGHPQPEIYLYKIQFSRLGENLLTVNYNSGKKMHLEFFVTEELETVIKKRSAHLINYQQVVNPTKWYDGLIGPWDMRNSVVRTPDNTDGFDLPWWMYVICTDDSALGHPAYVAQKNVRFPNQAEISGLEYYIENFVWGGLQRTDAETYPYCIYGVPNWYYNRQYDPLHIWRRYDYPHIFMMYYHMYEIAKYYPDMVSYLDANGYLERAYQTAMAYFVTTETIPNAPQKGLQFIAGTMNEVVLLNLMKSLQEEGWTAKAQALMAQWDKKVKYFIYDHPYPYVSEFAYDTTAYESSYAIAKWAMENPLQPDPQHPVVDQNDVIDFMQRQHLANVASRGWLEPSFYLLGNDYRGTSYRLSYMSQMGGWSVLDYALNYAGVDANDFIQLGFASYLSSWALVNTGPAPTYGFWYPGIANDGAAGWAFQSEKSGATWLQNRIVNRGVWYYDGEIDLGFSGGIRSAQAVVVSDDVFGLYGLGCDVTLNGIYYQIVPKDGLREVLVMHNLEMRLELNRDAFAKGQVVSIKKSRDYVSYVLENERLNAHTTKLDVKGLLIGNYELRINDIFQYAFYVPESGNIVLDISVGPAASYNVLIQMIWP